MRLVCYDLRSLFFYNFILSVWVNAELYTAIVDLEGLLKTEVILIENLKKYISLQEQKLETLKKRVQHYTEEHEKANADATEYLSNPINAYLLVKRLTTDWEVTEKFIEDDLYQRLQENITKIKDEVKFPTDEDLSGAAAALIRLQKTYNLDTESLARGELNGVKYSSSLSTHDCFELGRQSYNNQDFFHTVLWMREALRRYEVEKNETTVHEWEILEYLAYSLYMQGNVEAAHQLTEELLVLYPNHPRARNNLDYYTSVLEKEDENDERKKGDDGEIEESVEERTKPAHNNAVFDNSERMKYEMLCRRDIQLPLNIKSKLKCRYVHKNNPYLKIAPLKEEEAYLEPRILLYRDVIYPNEIEIVKQLAHPRLKRATVQNHKTGALETANYRISKSAWLGEREHFTVGAVRQRVSDITSLTVETAEELQVVNYGIGGHYEPHFDFARAEEKNAFKSLGTGNRIATVLFYMSDVAQGGATVFPALDLALWPEKGTAAFWMNLHSSGAGDYLTRHAACPVLQGSKWVSNVWLHEKGQEFLRPCDPADAITATS
ncbi:prolyl 4-hydroxylase subunit alpha-2-like isoform X3 [Planococcus citri]